MNFRLRFLVLMLAGIAMLTAPMAHAQSPCGNRNGGGVGGNGGENTNTPDPEEGDPVIPYTGNEFKTVDDLQVWGAVGDYPMVWSRHSNSRVVPGANSFGLAHYWRHSFQWELVKQSPDAQGRARVQVIYPTGSVFPFTEVSPGVWNNSDTSADTLRQSEAGFVLQTKDSFQYQFESFSSGNSAFFLMNRVTDPKGNEFLLTYDSARRFLSVREPGGRFLRAQYSTFPANKLNPIEISRLARTPEPSSWVTLPINNDSAFRYIRIVQADGSHGNIAEVEIYEAGTGAKLTGEVICSDSQATGSKAFDGDPATSFQSASSSGGFVGIKLPVAKRIGSIRILPAAGTEALHKPTQTWFAALKAEGSNEVPVSTTAITRVETSDGRAVDYQYSNIVDPTLPYVFPALTSAVYGDGTRAEYGHTQVFPGSRPLVSEWDDVRYSLRQGRYRTVYQSNQTVTVIGAVSAQVNLETGREILRIGLKNNNLHQPMVTFANGGSVVQYYGANKVGAYAILRREDQNGNLTSYTFHPDTGFMATEKDPLGRVTSYTYSATGQIASKTHPDATTEAWTYNDLGSVTSYTDTLGRTTTYTRDDSNRVVRIDHPDGTQEAFTHNSFGQILTHQMRNGGVETRQYDSWGLLVSLTDPVGQTTFFTYDSADRLATVTDALGRVTRIDSNERGLVTKITNPDGTFRSFTYTKYGDVATLTDELGHTTSTTYDVFRRVTSTTDPLGRTATQTYQPDSYQAAPLATTTPTGKTTAFTYDKEWNVLTATVATGTPEAATSIFAYDKVYKPVSVTDALGSVWRFTYDPRNRKLTETDPLNNVSRWSYDAAGNVRTQTRPDGGVTTNVHDTMDRLTQTTDPKGQTTRMAYDASGSVTSMTDAKGNSYAWTYDLLMRQTNMLYPGGSREQYGYDAVGNPTAYTTRAGQVRTSVFDSRNREIATNWSDTVTPDIARTYNAVGRILTEDNGLVRLAYTYDAANQLTSETSATVGQPARTVAYSHNADSLLASLTYPGGNVMSATYDARNLTATIGLDGQTLATYAYKPTGQVTSKSLENGLSTLYDYDAARRLTGIEHRKGFDMVASLAYTLDSVGNRRSKTTSGIGSLVEQYTYDPVDQLTQARYESDGNQRTVAYQYDATGNRQLVTDGGQTQAYSVNADNAYTQVGGQTTTSDTNGNMLSVPGATYTYDAQNRLISASINGSTTAFTYDARNRVVERRTGSTSLYFTYDRWNLIEERNTDGELEQVYVHGPRVDELLVKITPTGAAYYHHDALGSTVALSGENGQVLETYRYDAFGAASVFDSTFNLLPASRQNNRFLFTGREWLAEAKLYDYRNRIYSAQLGRFLQTDPIRFAAGDGNIYRYCRNNSTGRVDPMGLDDKEDEDEEPGEGGGGGGGGGGYSVLDYIQLTLDGIGLVPGPGEFADGINALISLARGDYLGASLSAGAMLPFAGWSATGAKFAVKAAAKRAGQLGREGEAAIQAATGLSKNTESFIVNGRTRIPDFITARDPAGFPTGLIESKNVQYQSLTRQLRDYGDLAGPGGRVDVALPPGASVSRPLQNAFDNPNNPLFRMDLP